MKINRKIQILVILTIVAIALAAIGISASTIINNKTQPQQNNIQDEESKCQQKGQCAYTNDESQCTQNGQCLNTEECGKQNCNYEQSQNCNDRPKSGCCKKT